MTRDRCPSIRRLTDDAITLVHPRKSCVSQLLLVACVKFSNMAMVIGSCRSRTCCVSRGRSRAAVDRLQLLEVEIGNRLQLLRQP